MTTITSVALLTICSGTRQLGRPSTTVTHHAAAATPPSSRGGYALVFSQHKHWTLHQYCTIYSNINRREGGKTPLFAVLDKIRQGFGWGGVDNWWDMWCEGSWISSPAGTVSTPPRCWPTNEAGGPGRARSCGHPAPYFWYSDTPAQLILCLYLGANKRTRILKTFLIFSLNIFILHLWQINN